MTSRALATLSFLCLSTFSFFSHAELPLPNKPHIVVEGSGTIKQIPDLAIVRFEIDATKGNLADAKQIVDKEVGKAIAAAKQVGVKEDDINASKIQAQPQYQWRQQNRQYLGERVSRQVELTLRDTSRYNDLVDALLKAGISRLQNTNLTFSELKQLEEQATVKALDDAKRKAETMAKHLGSEVGDVFQIAPVHTRPVMYGMEMRAADAASAKSAPLKVAKQQIEQKIRVVFFLED